MGKIVDRAQVALDRLSGRVSGIERIMLDQYLAH